MEQACLAVIHLSYMTSTVYLKTVLQSISIEALAQVLCWWFDSLVWISGISLCQACFVPVLCRNFISVSM